MTSQDKPEVSATDLITQGKALFRTAKFRPALTKFEAALKQEPDNDEALGLAAETAFRLDSQASAREYLLRRVESSGQRESVKAFCFQRVAMTYWREAHDIVAKHGELKNDKVVYALPEKELSEATQKIESGIEQATKALEMRGSFADAYNIRNLLQAEAALIADDSDDAKKYRQKSLDDLQMAMTMAKPAPDSKAGEAADFNYPTIRVSEFPRTKEEDKQIQDQMMKALEGGKPIKRVQAIFPSGRPAKPAGEQNDSSPSPGAGRSSLTAAYKPGTVKVEVLVSTEGRVIFTHIVDGRSDLNGAAIMAARGWTFEPAMLDGRPVQVSGVITFELKPGGAKTASPATANPPKKP